MHFSHQTSQPQSPEAVDPTAEIAPTETPLGLPHKAELWSGRIATIGFMTTVMAIAFKSTI